ncbi:MAG: plasmid pRiA4b ORF-3 family protein [Phycisphaerae bacterium]
MDKNESISVFKVTLEGNKKLWRRIAIQGNQTLDDLHEAIFSAFDRDEEHLYSFYFPKPGRSGRAALRDAAEYACPYNCKDQDIAALPGESPRNAEKAKIGALKLRTGQKFKYLFDFGDSWWHEITVETADAPAEEGKYPRILERHGESPQQYPDSEE